MQKQYVLAYDLGTSGVKGALVDFNGVLIAAETAQYPRYTPREGWAEQDPEDYWKGVCVVTQQVLSNAGITPDQIKGLSFATLWKGIIPVADGKVLRNSILWLDGRAGEQARKLNARFPNACYSGYDYWPKLMWLRENEPDVISRAEMILEVNSYLKWKATGVAAVDISNSFLRSFDPERDRYYEQMLSYMDIPREKIPPFVDSTRQVGVITPQAAVELGLMPGIPVFGGCNDIQAVCVGAGCGQIGSVHGYFGSSGWLGFTLEHGEKPASTPFDRKRDIQMAGMKAVGLSLNWMIQNFYPELADQLHDGIYDEVNRQVSQVPAGSEGLFATPWLFGENNLVAGPDARCCFLNANAQHTRPHMVRAMMEGVCYHLRQMSQVVCRDRNQPWPQRICAVGGGACSDVWMQILADVMAVPVYVPAQPRHAGAVGSAYCALIGLGVFPDFESISKQMEYSKCFRPEPEAEKVYSNGFAVYETLYNSLKPIFTTINEKR